MKDLPRPQMTHQEEGGREPNATADETTIDNSKVSVAKMEFNFAVACIPLATFADPCSVVGWLLHHPPLLLLFVLCTTCFSLTNFAIPCFVVGWMLCYALLHLIFTFAVDCFPHATFADPCSVVLGVPMEKTLMDMEDKH